MDQSRNDYILKNWNSNLWWVVTGIDGNTKNLGPLVNKMYVTKNSLFYQSSKSKQNSDTLSGTHKF